MRQQKSLAVLLLLLLLSISAAAAAAAPPLPKKNSIKVHRHSHRLLRPNDSPPISNRQQTILDWKTAGRTIPMQGNIMQIGAYFSNVCTLSFTHPLAFSR